MHHDVADHEQGRANVGDREEDLSRDLKSRGTVLAAHQHARRVAHDARCRRYISSPSPHARSSFAGPGAVARRNTWRTRRVNGAASSRAFP